LVLSLHCLSLPPGLHVSTSDIALQHWTCLSPSEGYKYLHFILVSWEHSTLSCCKRCSVNVYPVNNFAINFILFLVLGFELRACNLETLHQPFFVFSVFGIEPLKLFSRVDFELGPSCLCLLSG
jgi:hypothetical protein